MPRRMPRFDLKLRAHANIARGIANAGELSLRSRSPAAREWTPTRLEALYELAYVRLFSSWEAILEATLCRSLCGYASRAGQEVLLAGRYFPSLLAAETAILGGGAYVLWHNPTRVINKCRSFIDTRSPRSLGLQENVIVANQARLTHLASIRHRAVHDQSDARNKFDAATLAIAGRTYPGSRPGKFLRDMDRTTVPPRQWIETLTEDVIHYVAQMV